VFQDDIKRRLAFSTVSQVSYIALGAATFGPVGTIGGIVHIVHQAVMKITLFFAAGNLAETLHIHKVSELDGVGRRMPLTMAAFTVGAIGMIGMPPMAGFMTKWYLAQGAINSGQYWVLGILISSAVLNALYFLPIVYRAWFKSPETPWPEAAGARRFECGVSLFGPPVVTAVLTVAVGLFAGVPFSPLDWATFIMETEYRSWISR
jgi:multicomponent Na+:H+ antiporter subunit D